MRTELFALADGLFNRCDRLEFLFGGFQLAPQPAIFRLDDSYREPLVLQVLMGYSTTQIAEQMNLQQNAVLTRLFRARKQLKLALERRGLRGNDGGAA
mgnify:CR=1 FL=1